MGVIINQGTHDTTQDSKFEPITEKNVLMQVKKITLSERLKNSIDITFQILNGKHKNRFIFDTVTFDPDSIWAWKYRALRKSAGVPYNKGESQKIDIEALLLNKAVTVDLSVRKSTKADDDREFQNVTYKVASSTKAVVSNTKTQPAEEEAIDLDDLEGMDDVEDVVEETEDLNEVAEELEEFEEDEEEEEVEPTPPPKKKATTLSTKTKAKKKVTTPKEDALPDAFEEETPVTIDDDDDEWE